MDVSTMIVLIIIACVVVGIFVANQRTGFIWRIQAESKWKKIQPDIKSIQEMHDRYYESGYKVNFLDKNFLKSTKKKFDGHREKYNDYIEFCNKKNLPVKANHSEMAIIIEETEEAILNPNDAMNKALERAQKSYDEEYEIVSKEGESLLNYRKSSLAIISEVEDLVNSIAQKPKSFDADLKEIEIKKEQFNGILDYAEKQKVELEKAAKGIGVGVTAGTAVASMAPTAAMWVATTFGTASTGTAISALSGAAATNAALAWLGGGALAAGGGGMVAGQALLALAGPIGWGIVGTSALASVIIMVRKRLKLQEKKRDEIVRMKNCTEALKELETRVAAIRNQTEAIYSDLSGQVAMCMSYKNGDYSTFTSKDKKRLGALVNNTKALSALLSETVGDDD